MILIATKCFVGIVKDVEMDLRDVVPFGHVRSGWSIDIEGDPVDPIPLPSAGFHNVSPSFFRTAGLVMSGVVSGALRALLCQIGGRTRVSKASPE